SDSTRILRSGKAVFLLISAVSAGAAAYYWFVSALVPLPRMITYWGSTPENDPFYQALKQSAKLSQDGAFYASVSAITLAVAVVLEIFELGLICAIRVAATSTASFAHGWIRLLRLGRERK
ncbi:MAG: hypothetical protein ACREFQ_03810, partial [Stellaceae bacterium]